MAQRGRTPGFRMGAEHRGKIANSGILKRLIQHAEGEIEMTPTQVTAGLALLKKVMPDLQPEQFDDDEGTSALKHIVEVAFVSAAAKAHDA